MAIRNSLIGSCLLLASVLAAGHAGSAPGDFYSPLADAGERLPADGIFPQGRKLAFMGYSGEPARDLTNGFTVAGPVYAGQPDYLARCESNGWPVVAQVGYRVKFLDPRSAAALPGQPAVCREIQRQVQALAGYKEIVWWAVTPEELRPWMPGEMDYLKNVCETIRSNDPRHRPIYLYNPNHRNAGTLAPIAREVDLIAKGCYVNLTGHNLERAWVGWSVEQELAAIQSSGRPGAIPLLNPELCEDPDPAEDGEIQAWVRHDVYLGLASGAKGVVIWTLHPRGEVHRTWQIWYDAYAECGRELNGPTALARVFLFGEHRSDLKIRQTSGETTARVTLGGKVEASTTSARERVAAKVSLSAWTAAEFAYGTSRWFFLINSANSPSRFIISGWPDNSRAEDACTGAPIPLDGAGELPVSLPANGVFGLRLSGCASNSLTSSVPPARRAKL